MYFTQRLGLLGSLIILLLCLCACGSRSGPAPVVSLSTTVATPENLTEITGDTYLVQRGDTLFAVAFYSGNDYRELAKLNSIAAPYTIKIGQSLRLTLPSPAPTPMAIKNKNHAVSVQNSYKKEIDPKQKQGYGRVKPSIRQNEHTNVAAVSSKHSKQLSWIWPAYGNRNIATVGGDGSKRGLDIKGSLGSKVVSAANGKVVYAGNALKGYGNLVIIKHNDDYLSAYAHNKSILVNEQTYVKQGQQIATMGNSGASDVMLHFEIRKKGKSVDPFTYLPPY